MKKMILRVLLALLLLVLLAAAGFGVLYAGRLRTVNSIEKITDYSDYNLYRMDVRYDYSIDDVINYGITDNQSMIDAILKETLPLLPIHMKAPNFGCSVFCTQGTDGHTLMIVSYIGPQAIYTAPYFFAHWRDFSSRSFQSPRFRFGFCGQMLLI